MSQAEDTQARPRRRIPAWLEFLLLSAFALGLALLVKTFLVQMFFVPSESMQPQLQVDDKLLVEKVSLWGDGEVERGDVVVFSDPGGWLGEPPPLTHVQKALSLVGLYPTGGHLVKRVVAVGGDTVACCDDEGHLTVNGDPLDEKYLPRGTQPSSINFSVDVPEGRLWVMGDNRSNSEDSRYHRQEKGHGTIPESAVVGRVWAVVWPWSHVDVLDSPGAFDDVPDPKRAAPTLH